MHTAKRLEGIGEYYFSQKLREIELLNRNGIPVLNLGIGSPDQPPHPDVISTLQQESANPKQHAYQSYKGVPALRNAIANWYRQWYGVELDADSEVLTLMGSKEGIMHICMTYLDAGDAALVSNPGYPTYRSAVQLAGGTSMEYDLTEENNYQPDFSQLENIVTTSGKVKLLFVNYPHMPTGEPPDAKLFEQLVAFAKKHQLLIVHDNPYSFILNNHPESILSVPGAFDVALELNSLSKSHNMAGWRIGMLCGSAQHIGQVLQFKSNMDSGMFLPAQLAAAKALQLPAAWYQQVNETYMRRREKVFELLNHLKCRYRKQQSGLFVWSRVPDGVTDGFAMSDAILSQFRIFITPGGVFGSAGNQHIRLSLCSTEKVFEEALMRIQQKA